MGVEFYIALVSIFIIGIVLGGAATFFLRKATINRQLRTAERKANKVVIDAEHNAKNTLREARQEGERIKNSAGAEYRERLSELHRQENRINQKSETLDRKLENLENRERNLNNKNKEIESIRNSLEDLRNRQLKQLELISGMSSAEAKKALEVAIETEMQEETSRRLREWGLKLHEEANQEAREILSQAIQRLASDVVSEITISTVPLPSDEMKGRLIGREGRNIRALEQATGVDLIIDDTPEAVTLSSFNPVRREVARLALNKLILDGRIHPARIEEVVAKANEEVEASIQKAGDEALYQVGIHGLHPQLVKLLGRLKYRTSYGQNVLSHSIEVARLAAIIAGDLGANVNIAKKAGLLHDIGKTACLDNNEDHAAKGFEICLAHNLNSIADIIAEHVILKTYKPEYGFAEKEIVYYADKRVNHDQVVSLKERLEYILERYGKNNETRCLAIKKNYTRCQDLEKRMFSLLPFEPADISDVLAVQQSKFLQI